MAAKPVTRDKARFAAIERTKLARRSLRAPKPPSASIITGVVATMRTTIGIARRTPITSGSTPRLWSHTGKNGRYTPSPMNAAA
jgi:hypothetical protein